MASARWILQFGQRYVVYIAADQLKSAQGETRGMGNESLRAWGTYGALTAVVICGGILCKAGTTLGTVGTVLRTQQSHGLLGHRILGIVSRQMAVEPGLVGLAGRGADAGRRERGCGPGRCKNAVYTV